MSKKNCYLFTEGNAKMRELLGGKGANLAEMTNIGLPVPQGFTITTEASTQYYEDGRQINGEIMAEHDIQNGTLPDVDFICGVPDSGGPHAIGYANRSGIPFARPFIKYTPTWPRSFMPQSQSMRNKVAK